MRRSGNRKRNETHDTLLARAGHRYDKPYSRIGAYIIGMITAYIYVKTEARIRGVLPWIVVAVCVIVPPALAYTDICPDFQMDGKWGTVANVAYLSLSRPVWTCGVALLVFMCMRGDGGVVNKVLSWRPWDAMAKLTYGACEFSCRRAYSRACMEGRGGGGSTSFVSSALTLPPSPHALGRSDSPRLDAHRPLQPA